ncbi:hypothetical protein Slala03_66590 [Streptomyces lavendulae subsp. lavendulae]|uniref:hypothetical protein n=1 Tax=Streptomyces lavendulae TaxID=1914 RepID=UPI0024A27B7D|nr:hypothetical protein [Streptomyces lavendulae]GLV86970.1 hypothetical protein Slala03_66590 [Streptomyces lavendulae subsp. lavendulae]GLX41046.1 hypothetical protein Sros01_71190 [Streptomyces roseochromogenus]
MTSDTWTTTAVFTGPGGVPTGEAGTLTGEVSVRTVWEPEQARIAVQYVGASEWYTLAGSPVPCPSAEAARSVHQSAVEAVRTGGPITFTPWPTRPAAA